ncbi:baseplate J/gp47 family protein [uncultured Bartonella sp.]|uniref:baseplate assembly protein n=1 Tax=uncultured Bartonella sp. TaxID=104108 RepID=UPI0025FDC525|nr:baseplate J/gp47 family protein [uncultured Bartonella sp.]
MSRFIAPNLNDLGDVPAVEDVGFENIKSGRDAFLIAALKKIGLNYDVTSLETDPLVIAFSEGGGYSEIKIRQRVNEAIRSLSLVTAIGGDLDHLGTTYAGISRLVYENDKKDRPDDSDWNEEKGKWVESDDAYRNRILLAFEAFSTAGPEGAYVFHALELDGIRDVADAAVYSEEDAATYSDTMFSDAYSMGLKKTPFANRKEGAPVLAPEVLVVVAPTQNYGDADQTLLDRVFKAVTAADTRPIGDNVRIEAAKKHKYNINVSLYYAAGADVAALKTEAEKRLLAYAKARRRIGLAIQRDVIGGRAAVGDGVTVNVIEPAEDIDPGAKGFGEVGEIKVVPIQTRGTWRDDD